MGDLVYSICTNFVGMAMCSGKNVPKRFSREISELNFFSEDLRRNWTRGPKLSFGSAIDIGGGKRVVVLDPFSLIGVGVFKRLILCHSHELIELAEAYFESVE